MDTDGIVCRYKNLWFLVAVVQLFNRLASVFRPSVRSFVRSFVRVSVRSDISASVRAINLKFFMNVGSLRVSKIFFSFFKILSVWSDFGPKIPDFCAQKLKKKFFFKDSIFLKTAYLASKNIIFS